MGKEIKSTLSPEECTAVGNALVHYLQLSESIPPETVKPEVVRQEVGGLPPRRVIVVPEGLGLDRAKLWEGDDISQIPIERVVLWIEKSTKIRLAHAEWELELLLHFVAINRGNVTRAVTPANSATIFFDLEPNAPEGLPRATVRGAHSSPTDRLTHEMPEHTVYVKSDDPQFVRRVLSATKTEVGVS